MSFVANETRVKELFAQAKTPEAIYDLLLQLGRNQTPLSDPQIAVSGCQSRMFLHVRKEHDLFYFATVADALISAGIGQLLCLLYSGLSAREILTHPPLVLKELGVMSSLSPSRSSGLASLWQTMMKEIARQS